MATFTTETRLGAYNCKDMIEYLQSYRREYSAMERFVFRVINKNHGCTIKEKASLNTILQKKYGITKRTANSIIMDMTGRYNALVDLKQLELSQRQTKIDSLGQKIEKLKTGVSNMADQASRNELSPGRLANYRVKKHTLHAKKMKLARMKDRQAQLARDIENQNYKLSFGGEKMFQAQYHLADNGYHSHIGWKNDYIKHRDSHILYVGSSDETCGNQLFQLTNIGDNEYIVKLRKDGSFASKTPSEDNYVYGKCHIQYMNDKVKEILSNKSGPLTYRIKFRDNKVYLQIMITLKPETIPCITDTVSGTIGLDFNDGHIDLSETDEHGNLVYMTQYKLQYHGAGNKALNEMRQIASQIGKYAIKTRKSIVREDLSFVKKKAKTQKAKSKNGKDYNRMIHTLDYARYNECFNNMTFRKGIQQVLVNPAYTSQIAKQKYCKARKMPIHNGAAYVIARRGQGFKDTLSKPEKEDRIS